MAAAAATAQRNKGIDATAIGLISVDTEQAIRPIARDILYTMARNPKTNPEMKGRIARVYAEWNHGAEFKDDGFPIQSTALLGPPGHGKTTAFREAARRVALALGMRFLDNGEADGVEDVGPLDFVFVSQETAGVVSSLEWMGLPTGEDVPGKDGKPTGQRRMGRLYSGRLLKLQQAGGGVLLLDDFLNASPAIQGVGLSLTLEKRYNSLDLRNTYIAVTGNLGALDGTYTARPSTAFRNRLKAYFAEDNLANWSSRVQVKFNDELSDAGLLGFLQRFENQFSQDPDVKLSGGYPTPRSWEALLVEIRRIIASNGGRANMSRALPEIQMAASSIVGPVVGIEVSTYYHSLADTADPLARMVIMDGNLDTDAINQRFSKGFSANAQTFGHQYATALADYTVVKIQRDGGKLDQAIERFAKGIMHLEHNQVFALAVDHLQKKMAVRLPQLAEKMGANEWQLTHATKEAMAKIIAACPQFNAQTRDTLISTLSGIDKFTSATQRRQRRPV